MGPKKLGVLKERPCEDKDVPQMPAALIHLLEELQNAL